MSFMKKYNTWGGTSYSPVMEDIINVYTKKNPSNTPTFVLFITDGENDDRAKTEKIIKQASNHNIFWQFIGIGYESFKFLKELDTLKDRKVDNANFLQIKDINSVSDLQLYDMLLNEYPLWEKEARKFGLIK